jgi:hypothetical protein
MHPLGTLNVHISLTKEKITVKEITVVIALLSHRIITPLFFDTVNSSHYLTMLHIFIL